jgi:hypothetical protein
VRLFRTAMSTFTLPRWAYRVASFLLGGLAVAAAGGLAFTVVMPFSLQHTLDNSRQILSSFQTASRAIDTYRARAGVLPDHLAFGRLGGAYEVNLLDPASSDFSKCCADAVRALGVPPKQSYVLEVWRGEWIEYYAPWSGKSTLTLDPNDFAVTGNLYGDIAAMLIFTAFFTYGARRAWVTGSNPKG